MSSQEISDLLSANQGKDRYNAPDFYAIDDLLTDEQKLIRSSVREYVKRELSPIIEHFAQQAEFPRHIVKQLGEIGAFGPQLPIEYGCGGMDYTTYGIIMQELERCDSGVRSTASVQGSLVMYPIYKFGSEAQKQKYLPKLASGDWLGCFGLTEPDFSPLYERVKDMSDVEANASLPEDQTVALQITPA